MVYSEDTICKKRTQSAADIQPGCLMSLGPVLNVHPNEWDLESRISKLRLFRKKRCIYSLILFEVAELILRGARTKSGQMWVHFVFGFQRILDYSQTVRPQFSDVLLEQKVWISQV